MERLDADPDLLSIVGSWRDTLDDAEALSNAGTWEPLLVLEYLRVIGRDDQDIVETDRCGIFLPAVQRALLD